MMDDINEHPPPPISPVSILRTPKLKRKAPQAPLIPYQPPSPPHTPWTPEAASSVSDIVRSIENKFKTPSPPASATPPGSIKAPTPPVPTAFATPQGSIKAPTPPASATPPGSIKVSTPPPFATDSGSIKPPFPPAPATPLGSIKAHSLSSQLISLPTPSMSSVLSSNKTVDSGSGGIRVLEDDEIVIEQIPASNSTNSLPELPEEPPSSLQELICLVKERLLDILQCGMIKNSKYKWSIIIGLVIFFIIVVIVIIFVALFVETPGEDLGLLMIGGNDGNSTASVDLITFEGQCKSHKFPLLPEGRIGGVAGLLTSTLLLFCGGLNSNKQATTECWFHSKNSGGWTTAPSMPQPAAYAAQAISDRKFYVIGGLYNQEYLGTVQVFDGSRWSLSSGMTTPRFGACAVTYLSYLIVIGGLREYITTDNAVEVYSITRNKWKRMKMKNGFTGPFTGNCVSMLDDYNPGVLVFGGIDSENRNEPKMNKAAYNLKVNCEEDKCRLDDEIIPGAGYTIAWYPGFGRVNSKILMAGGKGDIESEKWITKGQDYGYWKNVGQMSRARDNVASVVIPISWSDYVIDC